jgi:hypothetical protein
MDREKKWPGREDTEVRHRHPVDLLPIRLQKIKFLIVEGASTKSY